MQHIINAWQTLNDNGPDTIAELLQSWGIKGRRGCGGDCCPLAEWLKRLSDHYRYFVYIDHLSISEVYGEEFAIVPLGDNIKRFINSFDVGRYPELETDEQA